MEKEKQAKDENVIFWYENVRKLTCHVVVIQ